MSDPTPEQVAKAIDSLPRLPQVRAILNAGMDPMEMVSAALDSEKYQMDSDFHILIDSVTNLLTVIGVQEQKIIELQEAQA